MTYPWGKVKGNSITSRSNVETKHVRTRALEEIMTSVGASQTFHHPKHLSIMFSKNVHLERFYLSSYILMNN